MPTMCGIFLQVLSECFQACRLLLFYLLQHHLGIPAKDSNSSGMEWAEQEQSLRRLLGQFGYNARCDTDFQKLCRGDKWYGEQGLIIMIKTTTIMMRTMLWRHTYGVTHTCIALLAWPYIRVCSRHHLSPHSTCLPPGIPLQNIN